MAKYAVTHTCGHHTDITLYGKGTERERAMRRLAAQPCTDCIRAEETRRAHAQAEAQHLPPLIGSEKQIAWAERIRYQTLLVIERLVPAEQYGDPVPIPDDLAFAPGETTTVGAIVDRLHTEDAARWWIDNAKRVQDIGRVPGYDDKAFARELLRRAAWGERIPDTGELAQSGDLRDNLRGLYQ